MLDRDLRTCVQVLEADGKAPEGILEKLTKVDFIAEELVQHQMQGLDEPKVGHAYERSKEGLSRQCEEQKLMIRQVKMRVDGLC